MILYLHSFYILNTLVFHRRTPHSSFLNLHLIIWFCTVRMGREKKKKSSSHFLQLSCCSTTGGKPFRISFGFQEPASLLQRVDLRVIWCCLYLSTSFALIVKECLGGLKLPYWLLLNLSFVSFSFCANVDIKRWIRAVGDRQVLNTIVGEQIQNGSCKIFFFFLPYCLLLTSLEDMLDLNSMWRH